MSSERLSRLQKWILAEALKGGYRDIWDHEHFRDCYFIGTHEIHRRFYRLPAGATVPAAQSVSLSRSLAALDRRGYLQTRRGGHYGDGERKVVLSGLGVEVAKNIAGTMVGPIIQLAGRGE